MGCKKAQEFLEANAAEPTEKVDATKQRFGRAEALELAKAADKVVVGKGKKVVVFDMRIAPPDDDALAAQLLGPSGNLKAPTLRMGGTLLVGFSEAAYQRVFGKP